MHAYIHECLITPWDTWVLAVSRWDYQSKLPWRRDGASGQSKLRSSPQTKVQYTNPVLADFLKCLDIERVEFKSVSHEFIRACWKGSQVLNFQRNSSCFLLHENGLRKQLIQKGVHHDKTKDTAHNPGNCKRISGYLCFGCAVQLFSAKCSAKPNHKRARHTGSLKLVRPHCPQVPPTFERLKAIHNHADLGRSSMDHNFNNGKTWKGKSMKRLGTSDNSLDSVCMCHGKNTITRILKKSVWDTLNFFRPQQPHSTV